jgi:hypothetical protein
MVALLAIEKQRLRAEKGELDRRDFDAAWEACWGVMVAERAWPHATVHRRAWRQAMVATRRECRAAFLDQPTAFAFAADRLREVAGGMCLSLGPDQVGKALLAAIAYVEVDEEDGRALSRASTAAHAFVTRPQTPTEGIAA